jgi:hypothetical protein
MTLLSCVPMTLLLMGVERLLSCFCRRYLVANSWIEIGARERPRIQPTVRVWRCELAGGVSTVLGKCSWAVSCWTGLNWAAGESE